MFNLSLMLLSVEVDHFSKKQDCKKYTFVAFYISCFEINLILPVKIIVFYIYIFIIQVKIHSFKKPV